METAMKKQLTMTEMSIVRIDYVHGMSLIPMIFEITDYAVPSRATAFFYVAKTGATNKKKLPATISGQSVTVTPEEDTFSDPGQYCGTLIIKQTNGKSFGSFPIFIEVMPNAGEEIK